MVNISYLEHKNTNKFVFQGVNLGKLDENTNMFAFHIQIGYRGWAQLNREKSLKGKVGGSMSSPANPIQSLAMELRCLESFCCLMIIERDILSAIPQMSSYPLSNNLSTLTSPQIKMSKQLFFNDFDQLIQLAFLTIVKYRWQILIRMFIWMLQVLFVGLLVLYYT